MGKIVAICNQKGGVGKTTTAVNLSTCVAAKATRVLLVDMDPQANATSGMGVDKRQARPSSYDVVIGTKLAAEVIVAGPIDGLRLIPSAKGLTGAEVELVDAAQREFRLRQALQPLRDGFDLCLIDCPPSLGLLTLNALVAADSVIIPIQCEYYALEGLTQLMETISLIKKRLNPQLCIEGVVLTMADFRTKLTQEVIKEVRSFFNEKVFDAIVPRNIKLSEAPGFGKPISLYDPFSIGAMKYDALADELLARLRTTVGRIMNSTIRIDHEQTPRQEPRVNQDSDAARHA